MPREIDLTPFDKELDRASRQWIRSSTRIPSEEVRALNKKAIDDQKASVIQNYRSLQQQVDALPPEGPIEQERERERKRERERFARLLSREAAQNCLLQAAVDLAIMELKYLPPQNLEQDSSKARAYLENRVHALLSELEAETSKPISSVPAPPKSSEMLVAENVAGRQGVAA